MNSILSRPDPVTIPSRRVPTEPQTKVLPESEAEHLRRVLDRLPVCMMRVSADGMLLAANKAALGLLAFEELGDALDTRLSDRIVEDDRPAWSSFTSRLLQGTPASVECRLLDPAGGDRLVLFQGAPLLDHPDQIASIVVIARDLPSAAVLERAALSREPIAGVELQPEAIAGQVDPKEEVAAFLAGLAATVPDPGQVEQQRQADPTAHNPTEQSELTRLELEATREALVAEKTIVAEQRAQLDAMIAERQQLTERAAKEAAEAQALTETQTQEPTELQQRVDAVEQQLRESTAALEALSQRYQATIAAGDRVAAELESSRAALVTEQRTVAEQRAQLDAVIVERKQLGDRAAHDAMEAKALEQRRTQERSELERRVDATEHRLNETAAALESLSQRHQVTITEGERLAAELASTHVALATEKATVADQRAELDGLITERQQLTERATKEAAEAQTLNDGHTRERTELQRRVDAVEQQLKASMSALAAEKAVGSELQAQLDAVVAERQQLSERAAREAADMQALKERYTQERTDLRRRVDTVEQQLRESTEALESLSQQHQVIVTNSERLAAELELASSALAREQMTVAEQRSQLEAVAAERQQFADRAAKDAADAQALAEMYTQHVTDLHRRVDELEQQLTESKQQAAHRDSESHDQRAATERQSAESTGPDLPKEELTQIHSELRRLHDDIARITQMCGQITSATENVAQPSVPEPRDPLSGALDDYRIEFEVLNEQVRESQRLAANAWLSADLTRALCRYVSSIDSLTRHLLAQSSLDADARSVVQALRADAVRAAIVARQISEIAPPRVAE